MIASLDSVPNTENLQKPREAASFRTQPLPTRTVDEILQDKDLPRNESWLVSDLIPYPGLTVVYGAPKCGKTTLLTYLAASIVSGGKFLDRDVKPGSVLWLDLEQDVRLTAETLGAAGATGHEHEIHLYNGLDATGPRMLETISKIGPTMVVVDSLSRFMRLKDENDASQVNRKIEPLLRACRDLGTSVLAIHHDRKREGNAGRNMRGSSAILATVDLSIEVRKADGDQSRRQLLMTGRCPGVPDRLGITLTETEYQVCEGIAYLQANDLLTALGNDSLTTQEWATKLGVTRPTVTNRVTTLIGSGQVTKTGSGKKGDPIRYSRAVPESIAASHP